MFAAYGSIAEGVTLKCQDVDTAELLIEVGAAKKGTLPDARAGGWVRFDWDDESLSERAARQLRRSGGAPDQSAARGAGEMNDFFCEKPEPPAGIFEEKMGGSAEPLQAKHGDDSERRAERHDGEN